MYKIVLNKQNGQSIVTLGIWKKIELNEHKNSYAEQIVVGFASDSICIQRQVWV